MKKRRLGSSELELTTIGVGAWAMGGPWLFGWGEQDDKASIEAIHQAIGEGVNWIDTAAVYGLGHSETVVAKAIKGKRQELTIATKCGLIWDDLGRVNGHLRKESIRRECENSLKRLEIDEIDLYQIHWPNPDEEIEEAVDELSKLVAEGKVRNVGVSNFNVSQMERALKIHPIVSLQPPYSMLKRDIEEEILPFCGENNIGVVAYSPLQSGLLTGKYDQEKIAALPDDDWRKSKNVEFQPPRLAANLALIEGLKPIAEEKGLTLAQLAIAWVLRRSEMTAAIVGMRSAKQAKSATPAASAALSQEEIERIEALLQKRDEKIS